MSKTNSIKCDSCGKELIVDTKYPHKYVFQLSAIDTAINNSGSTFLSCVYPPIDDDKHFCNSECLAMWANERLG